MKYLIFGTGDYYERYKKWFRKDEVVALLDNSLAKQNTEIDGNRVCSPEKGIELGYDKIIILSFYIKSMKQQLMELGVDESDILHFYDLHTIIDVKQYPECMRYYGGADKTVCSVDKRKTVLLLSHDLTLGGPAIALMHVAGVLLKQGMSVVYGSMLDGPLRERLLEKNIPVVVDEKLQIATMDEIDWVQDFSLILCNTINFHVFLTGRNTDIPIIWWLHDSLFFYDGIRKENLQAIDRANLKVVSVGPVPRLAIEQFLPDLEVGRLLYGVEDTAGVEDKPFMVRTVQDIQADYLNAEPVLRCVSIGYIEHRKGQDVLLEAIKRLPEELRKKTVFYLVGQDSSIMAQQIKQDIENIPEIIMTGSVDRTEIDRLLSHAHLLICPSREDPMPTVAAEAMMHSVPCLVSDAAGTAKYITNEKDGLVFVSECVDELTEKIKWCIENKNELNKMGFCARELFDRVFSMDAFERDLLPLVNDVFS